MSRSRTASDIPMFRRMGGLSELFPRASHTAKLLDHAMPCGVSVAMALGRNILALAEASANFRISCSSGLGVNFSSLPSSNGFRHVRL